MDLKKTNYNYQELKPISAIQSYEFIIKNKDQFVSQFGTEKCEATIADYEIHLGIREKPVRSSDRSSK